MQERDTQK